MKCETKDCKQEAKYFISTVHLKLCEEHKNILEHDILLKRQKRLKKQYLLIEK